MNFKRYHVSKNLLDKSTATLNYYMANAYEVATAMGAHSDYIAVEANSNYYVQQSVNPTQAFYTAVAYNANKQFISYINLPANTNDGILHTPENCAFVIINFYKSRVDSVMLNTGSTPQPYEPYSSEVWHSTPHYIHNTSTDTITTLPAVLYPNDTIATVGLKGNMSQTGTPTPENPIMPQGTGERTANLFDLESWLISNGAVFSKDGNAYTFSAVQSMFSTPFYFSDTDIPVSISGIMTGITAYNVRINLIRADGTTAKAYAVATKVTKSENIVCAGLNFDWSRPGTMRIDSLMLNLGSTALPYEPYGYKIPILSANTTTPVNLGEVESTRLIRELVLTGEENWRYSTSSRVHWIENVPNDYNNTLISRITTACTHYRCIRNDTGFSGMVNGDLRLYAKDVSPIAHELYIKDDTYTTAEDFKTYLAQQYAAGTPVTIWYVLATPETGIVNQPIRKIGNYADTVSGITIPVTAGGDSFDVLTTLKPSEVTVNYKGWHPVADVHEYDSNYTIATMQALTIAQLQTHTISDLQGGEWS